MANDATDETPPSERETEPEEAPEPKEAPEPSSPSRFDTLVPILAGVLLALPTIIARYPPMSDLPMHEAAVGVLRHFGDTTYFPDGLYRLNLGHPNQMFHLSSWALSYVVPTDWAVKLVIAISQVLILHAGAKLSDHLGRSRWGAVLLAPLALGFTYYWGLVANLLGYAVFLYALPPLDRFAETPTAKGLAKACGLFVLLFLAHESMFAIGAAVVGFFAILKPLDPKNTALRLGPAIFATIVAKAHLVYQAKLFPASAVVAPSTFFTLWQKIYFFPNVLFGSHEMGALLLLLLLCVVSLAGFLSSRVKHDPAPAPVTDTGVKRLRTIAHRLRFEAVAAIFALAYFVMPFNWNGATLLHERFLGPAWMIFVVCAAPKGMPVRIARIVATVVPVAILFVSWPQFYDSSSTFSDLDEIMARIPKGRAVELCALDRPIYRTRVYSAAVGPARVVAVRGGRSGLMLSLSPISPFLVDPKYRWDDADRRMITKGSRYLVPTVDLQRFDWVIAQSRDPETRRYIVAAFKPEAKLVAEKGEWLLLQSNYPPVPLMSPELVPEAGDPTILDRVMYLVRRDHEGKQPPEEAPAP